MSEWRDKIGGSTGVTGIGFNAQAWYETRELGTATYEADVAPEHSMQLFRKERNRVCDSVSQTNLIQPYSVLC